MGYLNAWAAVFQTEAFASQDLLVAFRVEVGEAFGEFYFFAVHLKGTEGGGFAGYGLCWKVITVDGEEPFHTGLFKFEYAGGFMRCACMNLKAAHGAEDPAEHVKEMDADVSGKATRLIFIAFPGIKVPVAAGSYIGQVNLMAFANFCGFHLVAKGYYCRVEAQLEYGVNALTGLFFYGFKGV